VEYDFKVNEFPWLHLSNKTQIGWIAQDVASLLPELVEVNEATGYYGIAYSHACPIMGQGIKELHSKMKKEVFEVRKDYEEKIKKLENDIEMLKMMMESLLIKKKADKEYN
jgi:hypothetical protein